MIKSRKIFTQKFLCDLIKKYPRKNSYLLGIAKYRKREKGLINCLNKMVSHLPKNIRNDAEFLSRIKSVNDEDFRGALGELVTNYVLKKNSLNPKMKPQIGKKTPDFYCSSKNHSFLVEAFSIGSTKEEEERRIQNFEFQKEISKIRSKFRIWTQGALVADGTGNFHGLGKEIKNYLKSKRKHDKNTIYRASTKKGAAVSFRVHTADKVGKIHWGSNYNQRGRDKYADLITNNLNIKVKKYRFPFVACCVAGTYCRANLEDLLEAVVGQSTMTVSFDPGNLSKPLKTKPSNDNQGFWGINNNEFDKNQLIQGIIYIQLSDREGNLKLYAYFLENPYFKNNLNQLFKDFPDPLRQKKGVSVSEIRGFEYRI